MTDNIERAMAAGLTRYEQKWGSNAATPLDTLICTLIVAHLHPEWAGWWGRMLFTSEPDESNRAFWRDLAQEIISTMPVEREEVA